MVDFYKTIKEKFYDRHLKKYFDERYGKYAETAEWFVNPAPNKWKCDFPTLHKRVVFTCDDDGVVTEKHYLIED